jgi:hypothetical protein
MENLEENAAINIQKVLSIKSDMHDIKGNKKQFFRVIPKWTDTESGRNMVPKSQYLYFSATRSGIG